MARGAGTAVGALLACCNIASALNPSLNISQYAHKAWTVRDGLFKSTVYSIAQTPDGYLWLATEFGLVRIDGVQEIPWRPPKGESLPDNWVTKLIASRDGRLWIGTYKGLASWKDGRLTRYPELDGFYVQSLLEDRDGTIWAGGSAIPIGKLCAIKSGSVTCGGGDGSLGVGVLALYEDPTGSLWAGAATGLWRWRPDPPKFYSTPEAPPEIIDLIKGDNGALWIAMHGGLRQLVDDRLEPVPGSAPPVQATSMMRDRDGGLWIGTDRGIRHVYRGRTTEFTQSDGLSGDSIYALYEDREHNVWIATDRGLDRFREFAIPAISIKEGLSSAIVDSVLAAKDNSVWIGTFDGLNRWKDGQITIYRQQGEGPLGDASRGGSSAATTAREIRGSGLQSRGLQSLFQDGRGRIWVSTRGGLAYVENERLIPVRGVPAAGQVFSLAEDTAGNLWISHDQGLFRLPPEGATEVAPWVTFGRDHAAVSLLADPENGLWLGFRDGVTYWKDGKVRASYGGLNGLGKGMVRGLQHDPDGTLWAATEGGLSRVKDGRVTTLTSKNGLPCDTVHWAMEDDQHSFWLYTSCGLVRISRASLDAWAADSAGRVESVVFDSSDGVSMQALASGYNPRVSKSTDGKIWFVYRDGVGVIDPRSLAFNPLPPPVHIVQTVADRTAYDASPGLRLPPLVRDLEIDYTALSLVAPEKNRFRVKLEGRDSDWKDMGNERKAFYSDLPPRNYRFRVMASNNNGVWNEAGASFDFSIKPAYYQTRWFQASCAAAFLALLWGLYRYRLHQIAREFNVRLDERVGERTRLARDLHDTLLQGFQGLMLRLQALDELLPQGEAKEELEQTLDRADQVVAEGRKAVHDLRLSTTVTNDLARAVRAVGDEFASEDSATFEFLLEGETRELHPIVRDEVYRITREALRNAFSHARARHIEAEITYGEQLFRLRIRDDGDGIAPAILEDGRPGHYGLPGMRERAAEIGAKLDIWSGVGTGTEIDLSIAGSIAYGKRPGRSRLRVFREKAE